MSFNWEVKDFPELGSPKDHLKHVLQEGLNEMVLVLLESRRPIRQIMPDCPSFFIDMGVQEGQVVQTTRFRPVLAQSLSSTTNGCRGNRGGFCGC